MRSVILWAFGAVALCGLASLPAGAQQPIHPHYHLHHALWELRDARKELKEAAHDFGGHRVKALAAVDAAIKQLDIALKNAGVPVEMHLYAQGGHAFGLRRTQLPITRWPQLVETWLKTIGMISK